jgi:chromosome segregation protein
MPARLKSFELHGYKTFATRSEFLFSDGITAIVGPNGSGKSNIADALRWVLGEQSFGLLRAKKTEDMIFSGSENRPRAGMASATVVFDNADGWLPIDFTEVGITRRAYRDGDNEYFLNNQRVRLKDVSEVLAKSGLAERTYTIIGQGLVDAALALKAEERRRLFEEAAGIGLHRARREEAIKRLETTGRNLERVQDILAELQPRLRSLERQAKRAQEYNQMKADLKQVLREWYGYHWHQAQAELVEAQICAKQNEEMFSEVQSRQLNLDERLGKYRQQISSLREKLGEYHNELTMLHQKRESLSREQAVRSERSRSLNEQMEHIRGEKNGAIEALEIQKSQSETASQELGQLENELSEANQSAAESTEALNQRLSVRTEIEQRLTALQDNINGLLTKQSELRARHNEKDAHVKRIKNNQQTAETEIQKAQDELFKAQKALAGLHQEKEERSSKSRAIEQEVGQIHEKLDLMEAERRQLNEKISSQKAIIAQTQAEIKVLEEAEKNLTGYDEGARILLQAMQEKRLKGAMGAFGSRLKVPEVYETAITAILGEYIDAMVIESIHESGAALDLIDQEAIRGSLLPLDAIFTIKPLALDLDKAPVERGNILGIASDLIEFDDVMQPVVDLLFGQSIIVKDRRAARTILSTGDLHNMPNLKVVTLKGEVFLASGPIVRGASRKGLFERPRQQRESKALLANAIGLGNEYERRSLRIEQGADELRRRENEAKEKYQKAIEDERALGNQLNQFELQAEKLRRNLQWQQEQKNRIQTELDNENLELASLGVEITDTQASMQIKQAELDGLNKEILSLPIDELQSQNTYWKTKTAVIERAILDAKNRQSDKANQYLGMEKTLKNLVQREDQLAHEVDDLTVAMAAGSQQERRLADSIEQLSETVTPMEEQLRNLEQEHNSLLTSDSEARQQLRAAEQQYTQAKINLARQTEAFESLRGRIEDDFGLVSFEYTDSVSGPKPLPLEGLVEELPRVEVLAPEVEDTIRQKKALIRRMGAINPEAENEYKEVKDRFDFLTSQVDDLLKAESDIREVIAELDGLMEREFRRTFEAVAQEFKQIFTRLFGGGSARLSLTDPDNMTETGIDIEARLPGRREQGLSLLSGGERSLTAAALVFALLRVSPTPFCILDEVDAMLDEANVGRFRELLSELSEKTQFIVITHNRNTVQAASIIYGVTMGRDSASQVISLRMDELGEEFGV